jgi:drug/metabolite transporter (DMT)-like permease
LRPGPNAVELLFLSYVVLSVLLTLYVLWARRGFAACFVQLRRHRRDVVLVTVLTLLSYLCIVAALGYGNVVLVTAGRNVGILLSTAAGIWLLRERVSRQRALGAWVVFGGLVLLVLG